MQLDGGEDHNNHKEQPRQGDSIPHLEVFKGIAIDIEHQEQG